jgi:DMSO reductase family type II enzyme heme b subunit
VYQTLRCFECHGEAGRGDGTSVPTFADDAGFPLPASDLTEGWRLKGGSSVEQIYLRLHTGLDGTPMPSFGAQVESGVISDEQLWRLAQYVRGLSPEQAPDVSQMIHVPAVAGPLPATPEDPAWNAIEAHYVSLAGQIVVKPRWFVPSIDGLWLRAVHDGTRLALKLTWHDPSRSPDPAFALGTMDGPIPSSQGPDRVTVTFPAQLEPDTLRGYFLGGDTRAPAYVWRWTSSPDSVEDGAGRGLTRFVRRAGPATVAHAARYDRGEWQLQLTRSLTASDGTATTFVAGQPLPISFFVADGSNGEIGPRGAVANWYMLHLEGGPSQATVR